MHHQLRFEITGNAPTPFQVAFSRTGNQLSATCTCNAGRLGKLCKHRMGLLKQDPSGLVSGNEAQISLIQGLFLASDAESTLEDLLQAEAALARAQRAFTQSKEAFLAIVQT